MNERRVLGIVQQCINACNERAYSPPYIVTLAGEHGARVGWRVDHEGAHSLAGDIRAAGEIEIGSRFAVSITDANLRPANFRVDRWELVDGTPLQPIITTPPEWDGN